MRGLNWGLLFAGLFAGQAAGAESATEAMTAFGLLGSWSVNCSKSMTTCDKNGCGSRNIYEVSPSGQLMSKFVIGSTTPGQGRIIETEIQAATRIADDKIKIISTQRQPSGVTLPTSRQPGERWETVLIKSGDKFRTLSAQREDGQKITIENGFAVRPEKLDQFPTNWIRTTMETQWFEKCAATADTMVKSDVSVRSDVIVRSNVSGYAVTFPSQPTVDVKDTPVGKLTINFALIGDNMFLSSEAASSIPDVSTALETSVTSLVKSFPVAIVTSRQSVDFVAVSGRALPAKTFSFVNRDIYGEGIVVASGQHLITVVGIDMSKVPSNTSGTRLAVKKFVFFAQNRKIGCSW